MKTWAAFLTTVLLSTLVVGCAAQTEQPPVEKPDPIRVAAYDIADRLSMPLTGAVRSHESTISATHDALTWGYLQLACKDGGYDLAPYSNRRVTFTVFDTSDPSGEGHRRLHIMSFQGSVIGAYISREQEVPGISGVGRRIE